MVPKGNGTIISAFRLQIVVPKKGVPEIFARTSLWEQWRPPRNKKY